MNPMIFNTMNPKLESLARIDNVFIASSTRMIYTHGHNDDRWPGRLVRSIVLGDILKSRPVGTRDQFWSIDT